MYTPPSSTERNPLSQQHNTHTIQSNDPSPFGYLLETSAFIPATTVTPVYHYPDQTAESSAPPSRLDVLYQSLATPASFDYQFYDSNSSAQPAFSFINQADMNLNQSAMVGSDQVTSISSSSLYQFTELSSLSPPFFPTTVNIPISSESGSYSIPHSNTSPSTPFINSTTPSVAITPTQYYYQKEEEASTTSAKSSSSSPSPSSKPNNTQPHESHKSTSSSSSSSKIYPCDLCDKVFHRAYNLKSHRLSHSKARPYECRFDACPWRFSRPHDLRRHEQLHAGHRPYGCSICGKRFSQLEALQRHARGDTICLRIAAMLAHAASLTETTTKADK